MRCQTALVAKEIELLRNPRKMDVMSHCSCWQSNLNPLTFEIEAINLGRFLFKGTNSCPKETIKRMDGNLTAKNPETPRPFDEDFLLCENVN